MGNPTFQKDVSLLSHLWASFLLEGLLSKFKDMSSVQESCWLLAHGIILAFWRFFMDYNYPWTGNPILTDQYFMELYRGFWRLLGWRWKSKQVKWLEVRLSHWFCPKMLGTHPESHDSFSILPFWCIPYVWSLDKPLSHHENEISWACSSSLPTLILGIHSGGFETLGRTHSKCYCLKFWYVSMMHLTRIHKQFDWGLEIPGMETGWNSWSSRLGLEVLLERGSLVPSCPAPGGVMVMLRLGIGWNRRLLSRAFFMTFYDSLRNSYCMILYVKLCFWQVCNCWKRNVQIKSGEIRKWKRCNASLEVFTVAVRGPSAWKVQSFLLCLRHERPERDLRHGAKLNVQQVLWSVHVSTLQSWPENRKNWYALLGVVCFELWFVVVLVVYDYILRIPQHEQHTGRLFGSCDLGRWTPGWTLRVETSPIQYPNLSFVDDIVDDIIKYHPNSSKFIQHLSISGYHTISCYNPFWRSPSVTHWTGLTVKSAKPAQALDNRRNQASQSCCAWAPAVRGFGFRRCFMRNK